MAVGVGSAKGRVWLIVADGRQEGASEGATLDELKEILKGLGAVAALNLDDGGSSTLVVHLPTVGLRVPNTHVHERAPGPRAPRGVGAGDGERIARMCR